MSSTSPTLIPTISRARVELSKNIIIILLKIKPKLLSNICYQLVEIPQKFQLSRFKD